MEFIKKLFWLDDRTGIPSTSKLIRWLSFFLATIFVFAGLSFIVFRWIELTSEEIEVMNIIKEFLIFLIPTVEGSFQANRLFKLRHGSAELVESETKEETKRVDI